MSAKKNPHLEAKARSPFDVLLSSAERCLEDHEVVLGVQGSWSLKNNPRFVFCKNYAKYEFFRNPTVRRDLQQIRVWLDAVVLSL